MPQIHRDNSRAEVSVVVEKADLNNLTAEHYQGINYWLSLFSRAGFGGRMFVPADERYLTWARYLLAIAVLTMRSLRGVECVNLCLRDRTT
jgi:hypothetical protein